MTRPQRLALLLVCAASASPIAAQVPAAPGAGTNTAFQPPAEERIGDDDYGRAVKLGENIFTHTGQYAGQYVGNHLSCSNCHLDGGRRADSAPLWAAFGLYPAYRSKMHRMDTFAMRVQECFEYSMNGTAPPLESPEIIALETYSQWLATGAPVGVKLPGQGYRKLPPPAPSANYERGHELYSQRCTACHGGEGAGQRANSMTIFPALWGADSYNWGAGMANMSNAAGFIQANMPLGNGGSLTPQQAWDLAAFVDGHERPQDPRYTVSVAETRKRFHDTPDSPYGTMVAGRLLGSAAPPSGPQPGPAH